MTTPNNIIQFPTRRRSITLTETPVVQAAPAVQVEEKPAKSTYEWEGFTITEGRMGDGKPTLTVYRTKSKSRFPKPLVNCYYRTDERRDAALAEFKAQEEAKAAYRAEQAAQKAAAKAAGHDLKVGDCLYASWGYDQTNVDFYQIVRVSKASVWFRAISGKIASSGSGCDQVVPVKDSFLPDDHYKGGTHSRTVGTGYNGSTSVKFNRQYLNKTDWSTSHYETSAGWGH